MSFRLKTILGIFVIEALLVTLLISNNVVNLREQAERDIYQRMESVGKIFTSTVKNSVIAFDIANLEVFVKEVVGTNDIVYAKITRDESILAQAGNEDARNARFIQDETVRDVSDQRFDREIPIVEAGVVFANLQIGIDVSMVDALVADARNDALIVGLFGLSLSALFSYLLGTFLTTKLYHLKRAAETVSGGELDIKLNDEGSDEVSTTAKAFNIMVGNIKSKVEDLEKERAKAQQANEAKSMFLANMSHEIRTPLNAVTTFSSLLFDRIDDPKSADMLRKIKISSDSLMSIVNDILDISKIEAGEFTLESIDFNLSNMLKDSLSIFEERCEEKGLEIVVDIPTILDSVFYADATRFRQIIINLVSNAIKFTEHGFIRVTAEVLSDDSDFVVTKIRVADSGIGIPAAKLAGLFQPFVQAEESTTRRFGGTGLGLAICSELSQRMGGEITAESVEGVGSAFSIVLPLKKSTQNCILEKKKASTTSSDSCRILVFEDNEMNQAVITEVLSRLNHQITIANNGLEGVEILKDQSFDLIFMDFQMPIMDGFQATQAIRQSEEKNNLDKTPIIAMTANSIAKDKEKGFAAGMDDYLAKPISIEAIESAIDTWFQSSQEISIQDEPLKSSGSSEADRVLAEMDEQSSQFELQEEATIDQAAIDLLDTLTGPQNPSFFSDQVGSFLEKCEEEPKAIQQFLDQSDFAQVKSVAHRFKTSCGIVGAKVLMNVCQDLEHAALAGDKEQVVGRVEILYEQTELAASALEELLAARLKKSA